MDREEFLDGLAEGFEPSPYVLEQIYILNGEYPGFAEAALKTMEEAGGWDIRPYFGDVISGREALREKALKEVYEWFSEELNERKEYKERWIEKRTQEILEERRRKQNS